MGLESEIDDVYHKTLVLEKSSKVILNKLDKLEEKIDNLITINKELQDKNNT